MLYYDDDDDFNLCYESGDEFCCDDTGERVYYKDMYMSFYTGIFDVVLESIKEGVDNYENYKYICPFFYGNISVDFNMLLSYNDQQKRDFIVSIALGCEFYTRILKGLRKKNKGNLIVVTSFNIELLFENEEQENEFIIYVKGIRFR